MSRMFKSALAALVLGAALTPVALAQTGIEQVSVKVAYSDLNMSSVEGGMTLLKRIKHAARKVCDDATLRSPLKPRSGIACRKATVESVVRQLGIGTLTMAWKDNGPGQTRLATR